MYEKLIFVNDDDIIRPDSYRNYYPLSFGPPGHGSLPRQSAGLLFLFGDYNSLHGPKNTSIQL